MSSVSPASEFFSDPSDSVPSDLVEHQSKIPAYLWLSLNMLDLQPATEIAKYRAYKEGKIDLQDYEKLSPVLTAPEEEDEEYEEIPPSEPFAVMEHNARPYTTSKNFRTEPPGELVFREAEPPSASLDLSLLPPGEISSARNEYLPASQELWRSLGKPAPDSAVIPKWKLPVAIGSGLAAVAAVTTMTYVNMHPVLLQQVPVVSQLTAPPVLPPIPPGQNLQGPDLAMGEFSDLSLGNINSITSPGGTTPIAQNPSNSGVAAAQNPVIANVITPPVAPANTVSANPNFAATTPPATTQPTTGTGNRLSDTLIRNLLPPNIQQMAERDVSQQPIVPQVPVTPGVQSSTTVKPYVPQAPNTQPKGSKKISDATGGNSQYQVMAKYINPIVLERIHSILPTATRAGDRIVLGSFNDKSAADSLVKKLKQQGVEAWLKQS
jgi:hypothetical protein